MMENGNIKIEKTKRDIINLCHYISDNNDLQLYLNFKLGYTGWILRFDLRHFNLK